MSILPSIVMIIIALLTGAVISWLLAKTSFATRVGALQSQLNQQQELLQQAMNAIQKTEDENIELESAKTEAQRLTAIAETNLKNEKQKIADLKLEKQEEYRRMNDDIGQLQRVNSEIKSANEGLKALYGETAKRLEEQQKFVTDAQQNLKDAFGSLSADALKNNNTSFVELAKAKLDEKVTEAKGELEKKEQAIDSLVRPLSESLTKMDEKIIALENKREGAYHNINTVLEGLQKSTQSLDKGSQSLVNALKTSGTRGKYGEIGLRRVVEFAGMTVHCDFIEQESVTTEDGLLRPDMIINLPERKNIVVDSKAPLDAYLKIFETEHESEQKQYLAQHARAVKDHLKKLSNKAYWSQFTDSPDYVVLYMQIESSFGAALQADPDLIEEAIRNKVIFATPTTLVTLLRTVGFVWQQRSVAENIEEIRDSGIELYNRTTVLLKHFSNMGGSLKTAVNHYNSAVSSLESRFIPQARKLYQLGSAYTKNTLPETDQIEASIRQIEFSNGEDSETKE